VESDKISRRESLDVAVVHAWEAAPADPCPVPAGHRVTRTLMRHLVGSERLAVTRHGCCVGVAAYQVVESPVRVVHEFLVDRRLSAAETATVVSTMLAALEFAARDARVTCLVALVGGDVPLEPFARRGYTALVADAAGAWLQKKLEACDWPASRSAHVH
jgi:hypothetical protein